MIQDVKRERRRYDSSRRREQAAANRWAMLGAARELFVSNGYAATTVAQIAERAGVSVESVYKAFGNKAGVVKRVFDVSIVGDDEPQSLVERAFVQRNMAETDPRRKLRAYAEHYTATAARSVPIIRLVREAAASDEGAAEVQRQLDRERLTGMGMFAAHLAASGHLRDGLTAEEARDVLYALISGEIYHVLVAERGWSAERFTEWFGQCLIDALLPRRGRR